AAAAHQCLEHAGALRSRAQRLETPRQVEPRPQARLAPPAVVRTRGPAGRVLRPTPPPMSPVEPRVRSRSTHQNLSIRAFSICFRLTIHRNREQMETG